jgi:SAM-dependent methyltransferase
MPRPPHSESQPSGADARETYDRLGEDYARRIDDNAFNAHYERPATLSLLPEVAGLRVLDAGCGPGAYANWLAERGAAVTAVDISPKMIALARARLGDRVRVIEHDLAQRLDFASDGEFDLVLSSLALHYLRDWEPVLKEFHRVLGNAGRVVISTHHPLMDFRLSPTGKYFATELLEDEWSGFGQPVTVRFYRRPLTAIFEAIAASGFRLERLLEPFPTTECRRQAPSDYERLSRKPWFLCLRLEKS